MDIGVLALIGAITCVFGFLTFVSIIYDFVFHLIKKRVNIKQELDDLRWELFQSKNELQRLKDTYEAEDDKQFLS